MYILILYKFKIIFRGFKSKKKINKFFKVCNLWMQFYKRGTKEVINM